MPGPSESVTLAYAAQLHATEVRAAADLPTAGSTQDRTFQHRAFNASGTLSGSSEPPVDAVAFQQITLGAGVTTLNLRAAPTINGVEDFDDKQVVAVLLEAMEDNTDPVVVAPGSTNAYALFGDGNECDVAPNETLMKVFRSGGVCSSPIVADAVKNIDFSGTEGDVINVLLVLGDPPA